MFARDSLVLAKIGTKYPSYVKISGVGNALENNESDQSICVKDKFAEYISVVDLLSNESNYVLLKEGSQLANFVEVSEIVDLLVVQTPVITNNDGAITITCATEGASIYYTIDGSTPTTSSTLYRGPFKLLKSATVKAKAFNTDMVSSDITSGEITVSLPIVTVDSYIQGSIFQAGKAVITIENPLFDGTDNSRIYVQTASVGNLTPIFSHAGFITDSKTVNYTGFAALSGMVSFTINIYKENGDRKEVLTYQDYLGVGEVPLIERAQPQMMSPVINVEDNTCTITKGTAAYANENPDAIYYRIDGGAWREYTGQLTVDQSCIVEAYATLEGFLDSDIQSANIEIIKLPTNWTQTSISQMANDICYGNGKFVVIGGYTSSTSTPSGAYSIDGINWTEIDDLKTGKGSAPQCICYGDGKFVFAGLQGKGAYSTDGIKWTAIGDLKLGTDMADSICYGGGKFVLFGGNGFGTYHHTTVSYSTDGVNWTSIDVAQFGTDILNHVCYGNGKFVVVGNDVNSTKPIIYYSEDGITWAAVDNLEIEGTKLNYICYGDGKFIAHSNTRNTAYSTDGVTWSIGGDLQFGTSNSYGVCYGNGFFVVVGGQEAASYSSDGMTWTSIDATQFDGAFLTNVGYGGNRFVAFSTNGTAFYSD